MKKRTHRRRQKRTHTGTFFGLILAVFSFCVWWSVSSAETVDPGIGGGKGEIPKQAIRLRILAHSDRPEEQWIKRKVRDEIVREIGSWKRKPKTIEEARKTIRERLPKFQALAEQTLKKYGFSHPVLVRFGKVPFPTKLYGERLYPAGEYEALLIQIGDGKGENWWCVLFPPLCFIDMENGDAVDPNRRSGTFASIAPAEELLKTEKRWEDRELRKNPLEVRFLLWDKLKEWFGE
jgi:stage II sporulation protein R